MWNFFYTLPLAKSSCVNYSLWYYLAMNYAHELVKMGWTQWRIAAEVGCRQAAVSRWVSGKRVPGGVNMLRLKALYESKVQV